MIKDPTHLSPRLGSMLYEGLVVFAVLLVGFLFPQIVLSGFGMTLAGKGLWLHLFLVLMFYFVWFWLKSVDKLEQHNDLPTHGPHVLVSL